MNIDEVHESGKAIQEALKNYTGGWANTEALQKITALADKAIRASDFDGYVSEKPHSLKNYAEILYSARKHQKYDQPGQSGVERVRSIVFSDAHIIATWSPVTSD